MRPIDAIRIYLGECGGSAPRDEITTALLEGGIAFGKKRGEANVRISMDLNLENGNLEEVDGMIRIPV